MHFGMRCVGGQRCAAGAARRRLDGRQGKRRCARSVPLTTNPSKTNPSKK